MRALSILVLLALAFAGCSDGGDETDGETSTTTTGPGGGMGNGGGSGGGGGGAGGNGTGDGAPTAPQDWYLHAEGECGSATYFLDNNDTGGDVDGCGSVGVGTAIFTLDGRGPSAAGSQAEGSTYIAVEGASYVEVWHVLYADGTQVGESEVWGGPIAGIGYAEIPWTVSGDIPAGATLTLEVHAFNAPSVFLGTEDDHASKFVVS